MHAFRILLPACAFLVCTRYDQVKLGGQRMQMKHVQYRYARLNQCAVLHAEKPVPEQVAFRLSTTTTVPLKKQVHPSHKENQTARKWHTPGARADSH